MLDVGCGEKGKNPNRMKGVVWRIAMPLRDHTVEPYSIPANMQALHGRWPNVAFEYLNRQLPRRYRMMPTSHLGRFYELDNAAVDRVSRGGDPTVYGSGSPSGDTVVLTMPPPTLTLEYTEPKFPVYEVKVLEIATNRIVAVIEFASPSNKDRPDTRAEFAAKCAHFFKNRVCVSIVDVAIGQKFNLYSDMLDLLGHEDPAFSGKRVPQYAATVIARENADSWVHRTESWAYPLTAGHMLPKIPIILSDNEMVMLDLEETYEESMLSLRIDPEIPGAP